MAVILYGGVMIDLPIFAHFLFQCANSRVPASIYGRLETLERDMRVQRNDKAFRESFTTAARQFGRVPISLTKIETEKLARLGATCPPIHTLDELARIAMLAIATVHLSKQACRSLFQDCYENGDVLERGAILRALPLLPHSDRFLPMALEACRSHIQPIFESIACENPYPVAHFPDQNFSQMVLKALFTETALSRIVGLERRITPELVRMAEDYANERRAAGRSIPSDIRRLVKQVE